MGRVVKACCCWLSVEKMETTGNVVVFILHQPLFKVALGHGSFQQTTPDFQSWHAWCSCEFPSTQKKTLTPPSLAVARPLPSPHDTGAPAQADVRAQISRTTDGEKGELKGELKEENKHFITESHAAEMNSGTDLKRYDLRHLPVDFLPMDRSAATFLGEGG